MMISAAPVISRAVEPIPNRDGAVVVARLAVALADPAQQEHLVVHREPEEHAEQEQRHPRLDEVDLLEAEQLVADAVLTNTSTSTPYAAPTDSRLRTIASSATTIDRNASVSSTKLSSSTNAITRGSQVSVTVR